MYFRVAAATEDIFETSSVELAEDLHNLTVADICEIHGVEDAEELDDVLEDHLYFDEAGHFGAGIYYNGVCCCDSIEALKAYFSLGSEGLAEAVIFVFEGEWMGSCSDGDVVIPTELLDRLPVSRLDKGDRNEKRHDSASPNGHRTDDTVDWACGGLDNR